MGPSPEMFRGLEQLCYGDRHPCNLPWDHFFTQEALTSLTYFFGQLLLNKFDLLPPLIWYKNKSKDGETQLVLLSTASSKAKQLEGVSKGSLPP